MVCDLLKGNNEQLRELAIELKVRREEENKRFQMLAPHALAAPAVAKTVAATTAPLAAPVTKRPESREKRALAPEALTAIRRGEQLAAAPKPRRAPERVPSEPPAAGQPAMKVPVVEIMQAEIVQAEVMPSGAAPAVAKKSSGASRDWGALLNGRRKPVELTRLNTVVAATASAPSEQLRVEPPLPAGLQDGFVLTRLVESRQPVSGLVVSIGAERVAKIRIVRCRPTFTR